MYSMVSRKKILRVDVAVMKENLSNDEISKLVRVESKDMIADCLTKKGASSKALLKLLRTGRKE